VASRRKSTSSPTGIPLVCMRKIAARPSRSGKGTCRMCSKRPGRSRAESIISNRFVAAITMTSCALSRPSISTSHFVSTFPKKATDRSVGLTGRAPERHRRLVSPACVCPQCYRSRLGTVSMAASHDTAKELAKWCCSLLKIEGKKETKRLHTFLKAPRTMASAAPR
jgi:hypothetical protein